MDYPGDYSMDRYKSVWLNIQLAARYSPYGWKLLGLIADEVSEDLLRVREYPFMDCSQQQFWVEYQIWTQLFSNNGFFPGETSLLKEIADLRLARRKAKDSEIGLREFNSRLDAMHRGPWKQSDAQTKLSTSSEIASGPSSQSTDTAGDTIMEETQTPPKTSSDRNPTVSDIEEEQVDDGMSDATAPGGISKKQWMFGVDGEMRQQSGFWKTNAPDNDPTTSFSHFHESSKLRKWLDLGINLSLPNEQINKALRKLDFIDTIDDYGWRKYSVKLDADPDVAVAFRCGKLGQDAVREVEEKLGVKLRGGSATCRTGYDEGRCFVVRVRPKDIMEVLQNEEAVKRKLDNALFFLGYWQWAVGEVTSKKKFGEGRKLPTLMEAYKTNTETRVRSTWNPPNSGNKDTSDRSKTFEDEENLTDSSAGTNNHFGPSTPFSLPQVSGSSTPTGLGYGLTQVNQPVVVQRSQKPREMASEFCLQSLPTACLKSRSLSRRVDGL